MRKDFNYAYPFGNKNERKDKIMCVLKIWGPFY